MCLKTLFSSYVFKTLVVLQRIKMSQYYGEDINVNVDLQRIKMSQYYSGDIKVKVDFSNYATRAGIKNISHIDTSSFALKTNLANLKTEVDKLGIDKLVSIPADLSKLSDMMKNDVVKKDVYDKVVIKVNNIDTVCLF